MKQIRMTRSRGKDLIRCSNCHNLSWVFLDSLLGVRKWQCPKCEGKVDVKTLVILTPIKRYIDLAMKYWIDGEEEVEYRCEESHKDYITRLKEYLESSQIGWELGDIENAKVIIKYCGYCGICNKCKKQVKLKLVDDEQTCPKCKSKDVRFLNVTGDVCPSCSNTDLKERSKVISTMVVSIKQIRSLKLPA